MIQLSLVTCLVTFQENFFFCKFFPLWKYPGLVFLQWIFSAGSVYSDFWIYGIVYGRYMAVFLRNWTPQHWIWWIYHAFYGWERFKFRSFIFLPLTFDMNSIKGYKQSIAHKKLILNYPLNLYYTYWACSVDNTNIIPWLLITWHCLLGKGLGLIWYTITLIVKNIYKQLLILTVPNVPCSRNGELSSIYFSLIP